MVAKNTHSDSFGDVLNIWCWSSLRLGEWSLERKVLWRFYTACLYFQRTVRHPFIFSPLAHFPWEGVSASAIQFEVERYSVQWTMQWNICVLECLMEGERNCNQPEWFDDVDGTIFSHNVLFKEESEMYGWNKDLIRSVNLPLKMYFTIGWHYVLPQNCLRECKSSHECNLWDARDCLWLRLAIVLLSINEFSVTVCKMNDRNECWDRVEPPPWPCIEISRYREQIYGGMIELLTAFVASLSLPLSLSFCLSLFPSSLDLTNRRILEAHKPKRQNRQHLSFL